MIQDELHTETSGVLTDAIQNLLNERSELLLSTDISILHVWKVRLDIGFDTPLVVEINEKLLVSMIMKYERDVIVTDLVCFVYQTIEDMLVESGLTINSTRS